MPILLLSFFSILILVFFIFQLDPESLRGLAVPRDALFTNLLYTTHSCYKLGALSPCYINVLPRDSFMSSRNACKPQALSFYPLIKPLPAHQSVSFTCFMVSFYECIFVASLFLRPSSLHVCPYHIYVSVSFPFYLFL